MTPDISQASSFHIEDIKPKLNYHSPHAHTCIETYFTLKNNKRYTPPRFPHTTAVKQEMETMMKSRCNVLGSNIERDWQTSITSWKQIVVGVSVQICVCVYMKLRVGERVMQRIPLISEIGSQDQKTRVVVTVGARDSKTSRRSAVLHVNIGLEIFRGK